jgi:hypothetical protein
MVGMLKKKLHESGNEVDRLLEICSSQEVNSENEKRAYEKQIKELKDINTTQYYKFLDQEKEIELIRNKFEESVVELKSMYENINERWVHKSVINKWEEERRNYEDEIASMHQKIQENSDNHHTVVLSHEREIKFLKSRYVADCLLLNEKVYIRIYIDT